MSAIRIFSDVPGDDPSSVGQIIRLYLHHLECRRADGSFSNDHLAGIKHHLANFERFVGTDKPIRDCRRYDLTAWLAHNPQWRSSSSRRNAVGAVLVCFHWAEEEELIEHCPYRRPRALAAVKDKPRRPAEFSEYRALIREGSKPLRQALFFLWHTGARTCEMRAMKFSDCILDGDNPRVVLVEHKTARMSGKPRVIVLDVVVARFIKHLKAHAKSEFVFTNCEGGPWDRHTFARHLRRTAKRIGLDDGVATRVSAYCLRHSWTCRAIEEGRVNIKEVADLLGHSDTKMVEKIYGSHTSQHLGYLTKTVNRLRRRVEGE